MSATEISTSPTALPAGTYRVDPVHSSASLAVKHMVVLTFHGRFEDFDATLTVDAELGDALGTVGEGLIDLARQRYEPARQAT
jgi:polyisoprenoid-binding protein YceI